MRLRYDTSISSEPAPLAFANDDGLRVEIHIRHNPDESVTLLAFSGRPGEAPVKTIQQGPYQLYDQAVAARRAIAAQLQDAGLRLSADQHPQWSLAVQRAVNQQRQERERSAVDYRFDPKDVFLDW